MAAVTPVLVDSVGGQHGPEPKGHESRARFASGGSRRREGGRGRERSEATEVVGADDPRSAGGRRSAEGAPPDAPLARNRERSRSAAARGRQSEAHEAQLA